MGEARWRDEADFNGGEHFNVERDDGALYLGRFFCYITIDSK